ncbi:hypothetical protein FKM82_012121 [Ascaphus truei]
MIESMESIPAPKILQTHRFLDGNPTSECLFSVQPLEHSFSPVCLIFVKSVIFVIVIIGQDVYFIIYLCVISTFLCMVYIKENPERVSLRFPFVLLGK